MRLMVARLSGQAGSTRAKEVCALDHRVTVNTLYGSVGEVGTGSWWEVLHHAEDPAECQCVT